MIGRESVFSLGSRRGVGACSPGWSWGKHIFPWTSLMCTTATAVDVNPVMVVVRRRGRRLSNFHFSWNFSVLFTGRCRRAGLELTL